MSLAIQSRSPEIWEECLDKDIGLTASICAGVHTLWKFVLREALRKDSLTCSTEGTKPARHLYRGGRVMELHMLLTQTG